MRIFERLIETLRAPAHQALIDLASIEGSVF